MRLRPGDRQRMLVYSRSWAGSLPHRPGVFLICDEDEHVLYVGESANVNRRVNDPDHHRRACWIERGWDLVGFLPVSGDGMIGILRRLSHERHLSERYTPPCNGYAPPTDAHG